MQGAFVTATGTGVGKTWFSTALTTASIQKGRRVVALKPIETGCNPDPADAIALAEACGDPSLANADGFYRAPEPLAPYAVEKRGGPAVGSLRAMAKRIKELSRGVQYTIVEGAGGVLVPLDREHTIADLAALLDLKAIVVARNQLGVLSYTLTAVEALRRRNVSVQAVVLNHVHRDTKGDLSRSSNREVLADYLPRVPVFRMPRVQSPDGMIDTAAEVLDYLRL